MAEGPHGPTYPVPQPEKGEGGLVFSRSGPCALPHPPAPCGNWGLAGYKNVDLTKVRITYLKQMQGGGSCSPKRLLARLLLWKKKWPAICDLAPPGWFFSSKGKFLVHVHFVPSHYFVKRLYLKPQSALAGLLKFLMMAGWVWLKSAMQGAVAGSCITGLEPNDWPTGSSDPASPTLAIEGKLWQGVMFRL